jgi:ADP-ribose pyrophosphatase YjhB (NUDIX family)
MAQKRPAPIPKNRTSWHAPFIGSLHLELWAYRNAITIIPEVSLTSEPLVIDGIVIKKAPRVVIEKNLARIFRQYNIIEFKGPESSFSTWDFLKCEAYVYLYAALKGVPLRDLTLTIIEAHYPRELVRYLKEERELKVKEAFPGIYYIEEGVIPMQVIVTGELAEEENLFLRNLRREVKAESLLRVFSETREKLRNPAVQAYMYALVEANAGSMEEVEKMELTEKDRKVLKEWWFVKAAIAENDAKWQKRAAEADAKWQKRADKWQKQIKTLKAQLAAK